ncbi:hypothetical protein BV22DRAFT_642627 [Leucogyrophana mollusca]|uniref:Uncharacterized protein n=1 Tax=Leucogyrophana mollusca TaxID=85980 RepID=A0ACB8BCT6_9AGAM|nr:hypothetical protein BV22DRAFT_642627 [Leucogyrophana mollusca]
MGKGGAVTIPLIVFIAVTSAASSELIVVPSLVSYEWIAPLFSCVVSYQAADITGCSVCRTYSRPQATGAEIAKVPHHSVCIWAAWMGCWTTIMGLLFL